MTETELRRLGPEPRSRTVGVRLAPQREAGPLEQAAAAAGMHLTDYIREAALDAAKRDAKRRERQQVAR